MLIHIVLPDGTEGDVDESLLVKRDYVDRDDDNEYTTAVEYRFRGIPDVLVHRSAHVRLKRVPEGAETILAQFGK